MSHMIADTIAELLEMADLIGLDRRHFQPASHPHFDVSQLYRQKAIAAGTAVLARREFVAKMRQQALRLKADPKEMLAYEDACRCCDRADERMRSALNWRD